MAIARNSTTAMIGPQSLRCAADGAIQFRMVKARTTVTTPQVVHPGQPGQCPSVDRMAKVIGQYPHF